MVQPSPRFSAAMLRTRALSAPAGRFASFVTLGLAAAVAATFLVDGACAAGAASRACPRSGAMLLAGGALASGGALIGFVTASMFRAGTEADRRARAETWSDIGKLAIIIGVFVAGWISTPDEVFAATRTATQVCMTDDGYLAMTIVWALGGACITALFGSVLAIAYRSRRIPDDDFGFGVDGAMHDAPANRSPRKVN